MEGRLWGRLAVLCVCLLVIVAGDANRSLTPDKGQAGRQSPSSAWTRQWAPPGTERKRSDQDEGRALGGGQRNSLILGDGEEHQREKRSSRMMEGGGPGEEKNQDGTTDNTDVTTSSSTGSSGATSGSTAAPEPTATGSTASSSTGSSGPTATATTGSPTTNSNTTTNIVTTVVTSPGLCLNGGMWDDGKCSCLDGFEGDHCQDRVCQNGGTWSSGVCQCTENFQGDRCQLAKDIVEIKDATVNATVEMTTKVDNRNFTDELKNTSSDAYKEFETEFREKMRKIYEHIAGYRDVEIYNLSSGSIVVNYNVLLEVPASAKAKETVDIISKDLVSAFQNYDECNEACKGENCSFCFNPSSTNVSGVGVQEVEARLCDDYIQEEFRSYYTPYLTDTGVVCITACDTRSAQPLPCVYGTCSVLLGGPQCECSDRMAFWYQDSACSSRISKVGVAMGVPVAILVIVTVVFSIFLLRSRRQKEEYRNKLVARSELYFDEDGNWDGSHGFAVGNQAATWEDMETPDSSYINLERVDTSRTMHIQRPTVVPRVEPPASQRRQDTGTRR